MKRSSRIVFCVLALLTVQTFLIGCSKGEKVESNDKPQSRKNKKDDN